MSGKIAADEISNGVFEILMKYAKNAPQTISADTVLEEIGLGSLEVVESVFDLEEKFDITIPNPGEMAEVDTRFKTAGEVVVAVQQLIAQTSVAT